MSFKNSMKRFGSFFKHLIDLREDTDVEATIASIDKSVEFRGANIWLLACAVIIASVGLNVNSTAVIIGAMLVSPLMGPICGIGLSVGIMDSERINRSLRNLLIMVLVSLISATLYFLLSPLSDAQSELLARTRPTIYDVLIALFGGLAGILAQSRKSQAMTAISGVAIATALMPPLCTAGYGLATAQFNYFVGAFYLFFINSFFIALATFVMVRYLRFPTKHYVDPMRHRRVARYITLFAILVIIPSLFSAVNMLRETSFNSSSIHYIMDLRENPQLEGSEMIHSEYTYRRDTSEIHLTYVGKALDGEQIGYMNRQLAKYGLDKTRLIIRQAGGTLDVNQQLDLIGDLIERREQTIREQQAQIEALEIKLVQMQDSRTDQQQLAREMRTLFPDVQQFAICNSVYTRTDNQHSDSIPTAIIHWSNPQQQSSQSAAITDWLKARLNVKQVKVIGN